MRYGKGIRGIDGLVDMFVFRRRNQIELLKTMAIAAAMINPDKFNDIARDLQKEMFPEMEHERERYIRDRMALMNKMKDWTLGIKVGGGKR